MEIVHNETPLQNEMRGLIATAVDENIDLLEKTLLEKANGVSYQTIYNQIDEYAKYLSTILDESITSLMNKHMMEEQDTSEILPDIDIDPIISQLHTVMNFSKQQTKHHQQPQPNVSLNKKINDLLLTDLNQTKALFEQLLTQISTMN